MGARDSGRDVNATCIYPYFYHLNAADLSERIVQGMENHRMPQLDFVGTDGVVYHSVSGASNAFAPPAQQDGGHGGAAKPSTMTAQMAYTFNRLPANFRPASIIVRVVEEQGVNFRVPFKFTDIPLSDPF